MKVVILAGGLGTRISEESNLRPKPMIEIGRRPILWHIMNIYSVQGFNEFIVCAGYKQHVIKEYFDDFFLHSSDITFDYRNGAKDVTVHGTDVMPWCVTVGNTGAFTMTGGRVKRVRKYIGDETFMLTYGDAVADVDLHKLLEHHKATGAVVTMTGVGIGQSKGVLSVNSRGMVTDFREKEDSDGSVINGGFMVCEPELFDLIEGDDTVLEGYPLTSLAQAGKLGCYRHRGFWQCMDTQREKQKLEKLWAEGNAPWKIW